MKREIRPAVLPAAVLAIALLAAPCVQAQTGYSVHNKTPAATPPAQPQAAEPAPQTPTQPAAPEASPPAGEPSGQAATTAPATAPATPEAQAEPGAQANAPKEPNALGAADGWDTQFGTTPPQSSRFSGSPDQIAIIEKINAYFNELKNLEGQFLQTDADDSRKKGRFFIERPGKVLFDYAPPSAQKIISNGEYLAIENHDLNTADRYPLDSTPFRLLLKETVNLAVDAQIVALDVGENVVVLTVEDKESRGVGQIRLFFDWPEIQLKEWIITDAQGLNTRIELAALETNKETDPELFNFSPTIGLPNFRGDGR
jgi:outer membrane lipoprotein-sorting protein